MRKVPVLILILLVAASLLTSYQCTSSTTTAPAPTTAAATPKPAATPTEVKPTFGKAETKDPDPAKLVQSQEWGEAPVNQVGIILKDGQTRKDAEKVAADLGGTIVGEVEFFGMYQVETKGTAEADLRASLEKARTLPAVEIAFPDQRVYRRDSPCKACSPLSDPFYGQGQNGRAYDMIGLKSAWNILKASGVKLNDVHVGVLDDAIYTKSGEIKGQTQITALDPQDSTDAPEKDNNGNVVNGGLNHGTLVTHVIAADPDNGGPAGVASPLGSKLKVSVKNLYTADPSYTEAAPDPADPTKVVKPSGKTYVSKTFASLVKQAEAGATIINCSFGPDKPEAGNQWRTAAFKSFLAKMQAKYPKVLFVAAAGNENGKLDGSNYGPGGIKAPNLITVGALENTGKRANFSNYATGDGEVTISAPGVKVAMGVGPDGKTVTASGTSFASPMVAGAAALLRSINPDLSAEQIKKYLADSSLPGTPEDKVSVPIPEGMGKGLLRVDAAVLKVINDMREKRGEKPLDGKLLEKLATIEGSATMKKATEYDIKASLTAVAEGGTNVKAEIRGGGATVTGAPSQKLTAPGALTWGVTLQDEKKKPTIRLCRLDTDSCCDLSLEVIDLNGQWKGTMTVTDVMVTSDIPIPDPLDPEKPPTIIKKEDCEKSIKEQNVKPSPVTMDFKATSADAGTMTTITTDDKGEEEKSEPMPYKFDGERVVIDGVEKGFNVKFAGKVEGGQTDYTLSGTFIITLDQDNTIILQVSGTFTVSKPKPTP